MAHRTTQRRTLAGGGPEPKPSSMEPTLLKRQPTKPTTTANSHRQNHPIPDPIKPAIEKISLSTINLSKSLNSDYKLRSFQKPTSQIFHLVDTHLQNEPKKKSFPQEEERKEAEKGISLKSSEEFLQKKKNKFGHSNSNVERVFSSLALVEGGGRRRRSLCGGSHVELGDVFANNGVKVVSVDMPPFMQIHAVECARKTHDSLEKFTSKALALTLKKEFDGVYGPAWHCIVGTSFGSFVTHSVGGFLYFSMDQKLYILLFKTTVQRAD